MDAEIRTRRATRVNFATSGEVVIDGTRHEGMLVDISMGGALLELVENPAVKPGAACHLSVHLNQGRLQLPFEGKCVHAGDRLVGIRFTRITVMAMTHLRRLLELNTGDVEQVRIDLHACIRSGTS